MHFRVDVYVDLRVEDIAVGSFTKFIERLRAYAVGPYDHGNFDLESYKIDDFDTQRGTIKFLITGTINPAVIYDRGLFDEWVRSRSGRITDVPNTTFACVSCGQEFDPEEFRYCPNCGGGSEDEDFEDEDFEDEDFEDEEDEEEEDAA